jgi:hypothetical protein
MDIEKLKAICVGALDYSMESEEFNCCLMVDSPQGHWAYEMPKELREYLAIATSANVLAMLECLEAAQSMRECLLVNRDDVTVQPYDTKRAALEEMLKGLG